MYTDEKYIYCVNCGLPLQKTKSDDTVDTFAKVLIWLIVIGVAASIILTIVVLVFFTNLMNGILP